MHVHAIAQEGPPKRDIFVNRIRPVLQKYCFDCHTGDDAENGVDLSKFENTDSVISDLETWSHVLDVLQKSEMQPEDEAQPTEKESEFVRNWILSTISQSNQVREPLGRVRRMNRFEYENTVRDLFRLSRNCFSNPARIVQTTSYFNPASGKMPRHVLGVSFFFNSHRRHSELPGVSSLPVDPPAEHGFANDQNELSLSPLLMENYLEISTAFLNSKDLPLICGIWESMFLPGNAKAGEEQLERAHQRLATFLPRAFRRPASDEEIGRYCNLFDAEYADTNSYLESMKTTVSAILVSPKFLFRSEYCLPSPTESEDGGRELLDEHHAIASRLSFFLWGSMPDAELFQAAREERLTNPEELARQVDRMMKDRKVKSLSVDFGMQWLKLQKASSVVPDKDLFPGYYVKELPPPAVSMMVEQLSNTGAVPLHRIEGVD